MLLMISLQLHSTFVSLCPSCSRFTVISEALNYATVFDDLSILKILFWTSIGLEMKFGIPKPRPTANASIQH